MIRCARCPEPATIQVLWTLAGSEVPMFAVCDRHELAEVQVSDRLNAGGAARVAFRSLPEQLSLEIEGPRFPKGTPEYAAYEAELKVELGKWSRREGEYGPAVPVCASSAHVPGLFEFREATACYVRSCITCGHALVTLPAEVAEDERLLLCWASHRPALAAMVRQAIVRRREAAAPVEPVELSADGPVGELLAGARCPGCGAFGMLRVGETELQCRGPYDDPRGQSCRHIWSTVAPESRYMLRGLPTPGYGDSHE